MTGAGFTITARGEPELAIGQQVTPSFFQVLRATPALGSQDLGQEQHGRLHCAWGKPRRVRERGLPLLVELRHSAA